MIFKAIILKSNPHIIREIYIDGEKTVRDLLTALEICYGWNQGTITASMDLSMWNMTEGHLQDLGKPMEIDILSCSMTCIEFFQQYDEVLVQVPMKENYYTRWNSRERENWKIHLSLLEDETYEIEEEGEDAFLFRSYGFHPLWDVSTLRDNNLAHQDLFVDNYAYVSGVGEIEVGTYVVDPKQINRRLKRLDQFSEIRKKNPSIGKKLKEILQLYKVDELKRCVQENDLGINPYKRKNQLILDIDKIYHKKKIWDRILEEMSWQEYEALKKVCYSSEDDTGIYNFYLFPTLVSYCLITKQDYRSPQIADSFVNYYTDMMESQGDEDLLQRKKWNQVFLVAAQLYGVFDKLICKRLAQIMFPEELDSNEIMSVWKTTKEWKALNAFYMYVPEFFIYNNKSVYDLISSETYQNGDTYIPTKKEAFDILKNGLTYSKEAAKAIMKAVSCLNRFYFRGDDQEFFLKYLYKMVRCGASRNEIWGNVSMMFDYSGSKQNRTHFLDVLDQYLSEVRRFEYRGFTEDEYKQRRK